LLVLNRLLLSRVVLEGHIRSAKELLFCLLAAQELSFKINRRKLAALLEHKVPDTFLIMHNVEEFLRQLWLQRLSNVLFIFAAALLRKTAYELLWSCSWQIGESTALSDTLGCATRLIKQLERSVSKHGIFQSLGIWMTCLRFSQKFHIFRILLSQ